MIAYYIHWRYPATADDANYYAGRDDDKLFHYEEIAKEYAENQLKQWQNDEKRFYDLDVKDNEEGLTSEEQEEWRKLANICSGDLPDSYSVRKREIKFEDED